MNTFVDDRTEDERHTHSVLIAGTDPFLSGCGGASVACWACRPEDADFVVRWVEKRGDMKRVRYTSVESLRRVRGHAHIYRVGVEHPALREKYGRDARNLRHSLLLHAQAFTGGEPLQTVEFTDVLTA